MPENSVLDRLLNLLGEGEDFFHCLVENYSSYPHASLFRIL